MVHFLIFYRSSVLALRIFHTPGNSVPFEQTFLVQSHLNDSKCNRFIFERSAKLPFIYINKLVFRYKYSRKKQEQTWLTLTEDQKLTL